MKKYDCRRPRPQPKHCKPRWLVRAAREVGLGGLTAPDKDFPASQVAELVRARREDRSRGALDAARAKGD